MLSRNEIVAMQEEDLTSVIYPLMCARNFEDRVIRVHHWNKSIFKEQVKFRENVSLSKVIGTSHGDYECQKYWSDIITSLRNHWYIIEFIQKQKILINAGRESNYKDWIGVSYYKIDNQYFPL